MLCQKTCVVIQSALALQVWARKSGIDSLKVICLMAVLGIANFTTMMKVGYNNDFRCTDFETSLLALSGYFMDSDARLRVAATLKDDETNQRCAILIAGLPKDWLALKKYAKYAIRAPDGTCFSSLEVAKRYAQR